MNLEQAKSIVEKHRQEQADLAAAQEIVAKAADDEAFRKQRELDGQGHLDEEEGFLKAIALLEAEHAKLIRERNLFLTAHPTLSAQDELRLRDLNRDIADLEQGVPRDASCSIRVGAILDRPEISRFRFHTPGLEVFRRRLAQLREAQPV